MDPKPELLVFNRKEVSVIIILLVLVALFSFTLGLRLGKTLGLNSNKMTAAETAPLAPAGEKKPGESGEKAAEGEHAAAPAATPAEHATAPEGQEKPAGEAAATVGEQGEDKGDTAAKAAEDRADSEFAAEAGKEKVSAGKTIPMSLPNEKKGEVSDKPRYTLQVGSHRTVAEAAEQVATLKRSGLDAFYVEAKVPGMGTRYRVGVGLYPTKEAAARTGAKLRAVNKAMPVFLPQKISE